MLLYGTPNAIRRKIRARLKFAITAVLVGAFVAACLLLGRHAYDKRRTEIQRLVTTAATLSQTLDLEVSAARALLTGLASSPALRVDDLAIFYEQLKATPVADGAWLLLFDRTKQILNTLRPFGDPELPTFADFGKTDKDVEFLKQVGFSITERMYAPIRKAVAFAAALKVDGTDGQLKYALVLVISDKRLTALLRKYHIDSSISLALFDRNVKGVVALTDDKVILDPKLPIALINNVNLPKSVVVNGIFNESGDSVRPLAIAYDRSPNTGWTATASIHRSALDEPIQEAFNRLIVLAIVLALIGVFIFRYMAKQIEAPLETLGTSIIEAEEQVAELTTWLLQVQEDEHQRIAQELHDSTAQHLVGAILSLARISGRLHVDLSATSALEDAQASVRLALAELRTFSFLLHPPDLGGRGLTAVLEDFVHTFGRRANIQEEVVIDAVADAMPIELQRTILRIAREALTNTYRHANAKKVTVKLSAKDSLIELVIADDGKGIVVSGGKEAVRYGIGIPSMRRRLLALGGGLQIDSSDSGTIVHAIIPWPNQMNGY